jgi:outer membrane protein OmpU
MKIITKGKNMNNFKKIGLSALAGSLVAFSANAVEMSVSGTSEITYTSQHGETVPTTSNPMGSNTSISFSGSGNVGWADVTIVRTLNDGITSALSAYQTMDMGDLGKVSFDSYGGGLEGLTPFDDKLPTAYEEVWNGLSSPGMSGAASNDTLGYSNSISGVGLSLAFTKGGSSMSGDGGTAEAVASAGSQKDWHLSYTVPGMDGLQVMYGESTLSKTLAGAADDKWTNAHVLYSVGSISAGYRHGEAILGGGLTTDIDAFSVAFNVNENLSVSIATQDKEITNTKVTETVDALSASYTIGAATVRSHISEASNAGNTTAQNAEYMEVSLILAF